MAHFNLEKFMGHFCIFNLLRSSLKRQNGPFEKYMGYCGIDGHHHTRDLYLTSGDLLLSIFQRLICKCKGDRSQLAEFDRSCQWYFGKREMDDVEIGKIKCLPRSSNPTP